MTYYIINPFNIIIRLLNLTCLYILKFFLCYNIKKEIFYDYTKKIEEKHLIDLYNVIYSSENPEWSKYNAPYFNEFKFIDLETFLLKNHHEYYLGEHVLGIFLDDKPIGIVTHYWESFATRWLEIGIVIYEQNTWSNGIGYTALNEFIKICFNKFPNIQHIGLTTWSGNLRMIRLAEKLGLLCEARIRKVRYFNGVYYDSIKYGILREEFFNNTI